MTSRGASRGAIAKSTPHILHIRPEALAKIFTSRKNLTETPGMALTSEFLGGIMTSRRATTSVLGGGNNFQRVNRGITTPHPQHNAGGSRKIAHQHKGPSVSGVPGVERGNVPTHPNTDDSAIIWATAIALLDQVKDRTCTSSPGERTRFLGPMERVEDSTHSPQRYNASTTLASFTADG